MSSVTWVWRWVRYVFTLCMIETTMKLSTMRTIMMTRNREREKEVDEEKVAVRCRWWEEEDVKKIDESSCWIEANYDWWRRIFRVNELKVIQTWKFDVRKELKAKQRVNEHFISSTRSEWTLFRWSYYRFFSKWMNFIMMRHKAWNNQDQKKQLEVISWTMRSDLSTEKLCYESRKSSRNWT